MSLSEQFILFSHLFKDNISTAVTAFTHRQKRGAFKRVFTLLNKMLGFVLDAERKDEASLQEEDDIYYFYL